MCALGVCHAGNGTLVFIEKGVKINRHMYLDLVKNAYYSVFMQDGRSPRKAKIVKEYTGNNLTLLDLRPTNSPGPRVMDYAMWGIHIAATRRSNSKWPSTEPPEHSRRGSLASGSTNFPKE